MTTITAPSPSSSRVLSIPDAGGSANIILSNTASQLQTINNQLVVGGVLGIFGSSDQLVFIPGGTGNQYTINVPNPAGSRTVSLPDVGLTCNFKLGVEYLQNVSSVNLYQPPIQGLPCLFKTLDLLMQLHFLVHLKV